jgi:hypothetical protein
LGILKGILFYGIGGLYARHGLGDSVFLHAPFCVASLNGAVLEENRSIKTVSETFLKNFFRHVNCLARPDPSSQCGYGKQSGEFGQQIIADWKNSKTTAG